MLARTFVLQYLITGGFAMHLTTRRSLEVGICLLTLATPAFCATCSIPEPGTFWLAGLGVGAVLLVRRMRSKK